MSIDQAPTAEVREAEALTIAQRAAKAVRHFDCMRRLTGELEHEAIEIGRELVAIQGMLTHGSWEAWVRVNMPFSVRQAQRYKRLAALDGHRRNREGLYDTGKHDIMSCLDMEAALVALAQDPPEKDASDENDDDGGAQKGAQKDPLKEFRAWWDKGIRWLDKVLADNDRNSPEAQDQRDKLTEVREWWEAMYRSRR